MTVNSTRSVTLGHVFVVDDESLLPVSDAWGSVPAGPRHRLPFLPAPPAARTVPPRLTMLDASW